MNNLFYSLEDLRNQTYPDWDEDKWIQIREVIDEIEEITKTLALDENTIYDDVKVYARSLKDNWNELKEWVNKHYDYYMNNEDYIGGRLCFTDIKNKMQEI